VQVVVASAVDNVIIRDFIVLLWSPGVTENGVPLGNFVLLEPFKAEATFTVKLKQAHSDYLINGRPS